MPSPEQALIDAFKELSPLMESCRRGAKQTDPQYLESVVNDARRAAAAYRLANLRIRPGAGEFEYDEDVLLTEVLWGDIARFEEREEKPIHIFQRGVLNYQELNILLNALEKVTEAMKQGKPVDPGFVCLGGGIDRAIRLVDCVATDMVQQLQDLARAHNTAIPGGLLMCRSASEREQQMYVTAQQIVYGCPSLFGHCDYSPHQACGAIRVAIEKLIRSAVGAFYFKLPCGRRKPVVFSKLLTACKRAAVASAVPWWKIDKAYRWANLYVHYGKTPMVAEITLVLRLLQRITMRGVEADGTGLRNAWTVHTIFPTEEKWQAVVSHLYRSCNMPVTAVLYIGGRKIVLEDDWVLNQIQQADPKGKSRHLPRPRGSCFRTLKAAVRCLVAHFLGSRR